VQFGIGNPTAVSFGKYEFHCKSYHKSLPLLPDVNEICALLGFYAA